MDPFFCDKRVIFLEIDGVLCVNALTFDLDAINNLRRIIDEVDCEIILSSRWRLFPERRTTIDAQLITSNIRPCSDQTADLGNKLTEISQWVGEHDIMDYVIVDNINILPPHTVLCRNGLTNDIARDIIASFM